MVDLRKIKRLVKVMWLPEEEGVVFDMRHEVAISPKDSLYRILSRNVDLDAWKRQYSEKYHDWLNSDDKTIYDIKSDVNVQMYSVLAEINKKSIEQDAVFFYWFDIDRTFNPEYKWEYCPLSGEKLVLLGSGFPSINSYVCPTHLLVFPA